MGSPSLEAAGVLVVFLVFAAMIFCVGMFIYLWLDY